MQENRDAEVGVKKVMQDGENATGKQGKGHPTTTALKKRHSRVVKIKYYIK